MTPAFFVLGAGIYQIYYVSFEKRGQESLRGLAFFLRLVVHHRSHAVLYFGVDYRYVEAPISVRPGTSATSICRCACWCVRGVAAPHRVLQLILTRTFIGRAIMAVAQDQLALRLMAVDPVRIKRIAFGISIATASLAGAFLIIIQPSSRRSARDYIGRVFAICVLGGMGSLPEP